MVAFAASYAAVASRFGGFGVDGVALEAVVGWTSENRRGYF